MKTMRSVIAGAVGAGKSTFVRTISEINVIETDCNATDITTLIKQETTVALDFGRLRLNPAMDLHIYGTPGQSRFDFMWDILIKHSHSYVLLVAAHRPENFSYTREIISFINQRVQIPMIVGLTHTDCPGALAPEEIISALGYNMNDKNRPPVLNVNPTDRSSVLEALVLLMGLVTSQSDVKLSQTP